MSNVTGVINNYVLCIISIFKTFSEISKEPSNIIMALQYFPEIHDLRDIYIIIR